MALFKQHNILHINGLSIFFRSFLGWYFTDPGYYQAIIVFFIIMSVSKYPGLSALLVQRIVRGDYRDRLPTTRDLALEFKVSRQTVTLALRPLIVRGLLSPSGSRGMLIKHGENLSVLRVMVVSSGDDALVAGDASLASLLSRMRLDGLQASLHGVLPDYSSQESLRRLLMTASGVLFTNSALTVDIATHLDKFNIPFVSCNRLPAFPRLHTVETNWSGAIRGLAEKIVAAGFTRLGLFFHGRLKGYNAMIRKEWQRIKETLAIPSLPCDEIALSYRTAMTTNFRRLLSALKESEEYPEVLLVWNGIDKQVVDLLYHSDVSVPQTCQIIGCAKQGVEYPPELGVFHEGESYQKTLFAAYTALWEVMLAPTSQRIRRFVDFEVNCDWKRGK